MPLHMEHIINTSTCGKTLTENKLEEAVLVSMNKAIKKDSHEIV